MTTQEFSNEFDILYNNVLSNQAPGLDEYEKSIFLNKAQREIVRAYFEDSRNKDLAGFDGSVKRQYDFSTLLKNMALPSVTNLLSVMPSLGSVNQFDNRSILFAAPSDLFLSINEQVVDSTGRIFSVVPIDYIDYSRHMAKPYAYPIKRKAWRLICDKSSTLNGFNTIQLDNGSYLVFGNATTKPLNITVTCTATDGSGSVVYSDLVEGEDVNSLSITINVGTSGGAESGIGSLNTAIQNGTSKYGLSLISLQGDNLTGYGSVLDGKVYYVTVYPSITESGIALESPIYELIGRFTGDIIYKMRYVRLPKPIILVDLDDVAEGLSIEGYTTVSECELPKDLHYEILQRAVEFAKASYIANAGTQGGDNTLANMVSLGTNSQTSLGMIARSNGQQ